MFRIPGEKRLSVKVERSRFVKATLATLATGEWNRMNAVRVVACVVFGLVDGRIVSGNKQPLCWAQNRIRVGYTETVCMLICECI